MPGRTPGQWARAALLAAGLLLLLGLSAPTPASVATGAALVLAGEALRVWTAGHLRKTDVLVTSGPYRYTRNPMYLGRLAVGTGLLLAAWMPHGATLLLLPLFWAGFLLIYMRRKERVEPARLEARHGERYRAYRDAVPALVPRWTPWGGAERAGWDRARYARNRETLTAVLLGLLLVALALRASVASSAG